jgi:ABC-type transport system, involved in lipoprotein release, permease component
MISTFAWRNIWRNKLRSAIIITSIALGIFAGIFIIAFMNGMVNGRIDAIIRTEMSHIQMHQPGFEDNNQLTAGISDANQIIVRAKVLPHVIAASKRIIVNAMAASAEDVSGVKVSGIDPANEKQLTNISTSVFEGKYLDTTGRNPVVIGERLAKKLKVHLHSKVVITTQDLNKNIVSGAFRITGIYRTANAMFDESHLFVRNGDLTRLAGLDPGAAQEIAILLDNDKFTQSTTKILSGRYPRLEVRQWKDLSPEATVLIGGMNLKMVVILVIIMLALCFGIVNTMLMVVMERTHELGMLMCIGMNRIKVFIMIMLETIYLSLTGGAAGIILGFLITRIWSKTGLDLYAVKEEVAQIGFSSVIYPVIANEAIVATTIMVVLAGISSAIYPAYKAVSLNPSGSIRTE